MKYERGDYLVVVKEALGHAFQVGSKIRVIEVDHSDNTLPYKCEDDNGDWWWVCDEEVTSLKTGLDFSAITAIQQHIYAGNVVAGWWKNIVTGEPAARGDITLILSKLALVHSEVSEATEGVRKGLMDDHLKHRPMVEVELADAIIRILDLAGHEGYDVAGAIKEKLEYNAQRLDHKIENRLAEGGKKA